MKTIGNLLANTANPETLLDMAKLEKPIPLLFNSDDKELRFCLDTEETNKGREENGTTNARFSGKGNYKGK